MGRLSNWFIVPSILVMYRSHKSPFHLSSSWNKRKLKRKNSPSMWLVVDNTSKSVIIYVTFSRMPLHFLGTYQNFINGIVLHCHSHCLKKSLLFWLKTWLVSLSLWSWIMKKNIQKCDWIKTLFSLTLTKVYFLGEELKTPWEIFKLWCTNLI